MIVQSKKGYYKTLQIAVKEDFSEKYFNADDVGSGMQNLILLSIFQTYAKLSGGKAILAMEEPELFLYPHAQRELYNNFQALSINTQIFYTTHNPNFIDANRGFEIEIVSKNKDMGTFIYKKNTTLLNKATFKGKGRAAELANLLETILQRKNDCNYNKQYEEAARLRSIEVALLTDIKRFLKR